MRKRKVDELDDLGLGKELDAEELSARVLFTARVGQLDLREFLYKDPRDQKTKVDKIRLGKRFFKEYTAARVAAEVLPKAEGGWRKKKEEFDSGKD